MIIDAHAHIGSFGNKEYTPEELVSSMKEAGIDYSLVIAQPFDSSGKNLGGMEYILKATQKYSQLKPIGFVDINRLDSAYIEELKNLLLERKIYGLKFYLGYMEFYPNDERLHSLYSFCEKKGFPVIFHTGVLAIGVRGFLKYSHPLGVDDVAVLFPGLKIVIAHFGNPWVMDAAAVTAKNKNVYVDLSGYFTEYASISKKEQQEFLQDLEHFHSFVGDFKKCLFGSDWWLYDQKEYLKSVESLPFTKDKEERDLVLWKNACEVFGLDV